MSALVLMTAKRVMFSNVGSLSGHQPLAALQVAGLVE